MIDCFKVLIFSAVLFLCFPAGSFAQKQKLKSVKIEWEDFGTESFVAVSCTQFNSQFKNSKQTRLVKAKAEMQAFDNSAKEFVINEGTNSIDVRGLVTFNYSKVRVKYCFDQFGLFYGKGNYFTDKKLMALILKYVAPKG
ncbi:hypothetical protein [Pedobacter miscanthi]|uniref:Uncharacterized protein n=1 Tax=Pedobacter miscanthi TaxID=2259170 RepID=A0A366L095_9SPHI|nr:hypothetical protein [Pedobacter miscanthi]RBQ06724.1 hypothetical protein DRW42_13150 [Pedobacter miscanthi]